MLETQRAAQQRHSAALEGIADVVLEVCIDSWSEESVRACRLASANDAAYADLFGDAPSCDAAGSWPKLCVDADQLVQLLMSVHGGGKSRAELRFLQANSCAYSTVRVSVTRMPDSDHGINLMVVCHNLTDFRERLDLERDRRSYSSGMLHAAWCMMA